MRDWRWHSYLISASTVCGVALAYRGERSRFAPGRLAAVTVGSERDHHLSEVPPVPCHPARSQVEVKGEMVR